MDDSQIRHPIQNYPQTHPRQTLADHEGMTELLQSTNELMMQWSMQDNASNLEAALSSPLLERRDAVTLYDALKAATGTKLEPDLMTTLVDCRAIVVKGLSMAIQSLPPGGEEEHLKPYWDVMDLMHKFPGFVDEVGGDEADRPNQEAPYIVSNTVMSLIRVHNRITGDSS